MAADAESGPSTTPVRLGVWSHPLLAPHEGPVGASGAVVEHLAWRLRAAARAYGGPRGLTWLDPGGPACDADAETIVTAFPAEVRRWNGPTDGPLDAFLDDLAPGPGTTGADGGAVRFRGGWIGYCSYECAGSLLGVPLSARRDLHVPLASWARFPLWFRIGVAQPRLELWGSGPAAPGTPGIDAWRHWAEEALRAPLDRTTPMASVPAQLRTRPTPPRAAALALARSGAPSLPQPAFRDAVAVVQHAIEEGETFQANVAQRFSLPTHADPFAVYVQVRRLNPSPFACFIEEDWGALVSNSPERLFAVADEPGGRVVSARPIAGTRPRTGEEHEDARHRRDLARSEKERAEHTMLVDLARNDVGRVSVPGSVSVDAFQVVQAYSHVHHLVSDVRGTLLPGAPFSLVMAALFPGGTITGAPKLRSMEVIDGVEPVARGPYTGSAGFVNADGTADLNILIRTLIAENGRAHVYAGAGIVADSEADAEYEETLHKAAALLVAYASVVADGPPPATLPAQLGRHL